VRLLRVYHHWLSQRKLGLFLLETVAVIGLFLASARTVAPRLPLDELGKGHSLGLALACAALVQTSLYFADLYDIRGASADRSCGVRLLRALGVAFGLAAGAVLVLPEEPPGMALLAGAAGAATAVFLVRWALPWVVGRPTRVLVLGEGVRGQELARAIESSGEFEVAALARPRRDGETTEPDTLALNLKAKTVVVACEEESTGLLPEPLLRCRLMGIPVFSASSFAERVLRRLPISYLRPSDLIYAEGFRTGRLNTALKRALDLSAALVLFAVFSPVMLFAALAVRLSSPGPVLYSQERVGLGGRVFKLTKFRTMRTDAESGGTPVWAGENDPRVTRVGRLLRTTRLDELPQLFAVLRGDMSLVGPRPERPYFVEQIKQAVPYYELREAVKPGLTGWAQIRYPYGASIDDARAKLEHDLYYMKNRSLFLDLAILFHTVRHVLSGRGAR